MAVLSFSVHHQVVVMATTFVIQRKKKDEIIHLFFCFEFASLSNSRRFLMRFYNANTIKKRID